KRGFRRRFAPKAGAIHPAAWLCSRVKFIRRSRRGFPGALLRFLPGRHPISAEPARSGAGKRCYVKKPWLLLRLTLVATKFILDIIIDMLSYGYRRMCPEMAGQNQLQKPQGTSKTPTYTKSVSWGHHRMIIPMVLLRNMCKNSW
ncbi:hypothetical protein NL349_26130, partial [Klebsiella pneumoniae]|nr:hypothetical protein [Klebsiella pneumoniae]